MLSVATTNLIPVVLLGVMVALTLIFLPHLHDDTSRRVDEPPLDEQRSHEKGGLHTQSMQSSRDPER